jgi:hypothetical protein
LGFLAFGRLGERVDYEVIREGTMTKLALTLFTGLTLVGAADVAGTWDVETEFDDARLSGGGFDCTFTQDHEHFTGTCSGAPVTGDVKDQSITWEMKAGGDPPVTTVFNGTVSQSGTGMRGTFSVAGKTGITGHFTGYKK